MKLLKTLIFLVFGIVGSRAQPPEFQKELPAFTKIVVSPKINVILQKGSSESVRVRYNRIAPEKIHVEVSGTTLRLYLDGARMVDRRETMWVDGRKTKESVYRSVIITAYVTYTLLEKLCVRGEEEVSIYDAVETSKFIIKAYGESEIELASLQSDALKVTMYGNNWLRIKSGEIGRQKLKLYGENKVDTRNIECREITTTIYGEGIVKAKASNLFHLNALGEPRVQISGNAVMKKGYVLGNPSIQMGL